jgi:hypothetical protein
MKRWELQIRGKHSGLVHPLPFARFRRRRNAEKALVRMKEAREGVEYRIADLRR